MATRYSYNQLKLLYGENDTQVKNINSFICTIGDCPENRQLEAFRRLMRCPACGYWDFNGIECYACGYRA